MNYDQETVDLEVNIIHETDSAILVDYDGEEVWLPLSQVLEIHRTKPATIVITEWIALKKDLI